jgi:primosomal protein N' (replication factor Y) (superfamily II helicase)
MFAEVAIPVHVHQTFTYILPESLEHARPGTRVVVPLGNQLVTGYLVALLNADEFSVDPGVELKVVVQVVDEEPLVTAELMSLTQWVSDYYRAPWGEVIKSCLPAGINADTESILTITDAGRKALESASPRSLNSARMKTLMMLASSSSLNLKELSGPSEKTRVSAVVRSLERDALVTTKHEIPLQTVRPKRQQAVRLTTRQMEATGKPLSAAQTRIIDVLRSSDECSYAALLELAQASSSVVRTLERREFVEVFERDVRRDPLAHMNDESPELFSLTPKQQITLDAITAQLQAGEFGAVLLHGVTGSGKTEVYMRAMRIALDLGRSAMMLVPEISLTPMFARRLRAHFGSKVAILHSSLSEGERLDEWQRLRRGEARVCIGARSAVFAPLDNLGLIVVDEEHEGSYKQEESPRYHARDTAIVRASRNGAVVVLGSATPSMESFQNARSGKYTYLRLDERIGNKPLADVAVVDMREVFTRHGKAQVLSDEVKEAIAGNLTRGEQTMVLLNRRGYSSYILCRSCGKSVNCSDCDVTLTYHKVAARLICHYCGQQKRVPASCPECRAPYLHFIGEGTEQIEAILREHFPAVKIARMDRDTTRKKGAFERVLQQFGVGEIDVLVGTQMIAKGHDFHNVTLVCVISVDGGLAVPDFRSAERTFQLLTQVSGRAGRGDKPGRVLIQTYHPEHYAIEFAREQIYDRFFEHEVHFRREMRYPPFYSLINVMVRNREYNVAASIAAEFARRIREMNTEGALRVLGPATAPIGRLRGEHRLQVLIKTNNRTLARSAVDQALLKMKEERFDLRSLSVDVDPVSLM